MVRIENWKTLKRFRFKKSIALSVENTEKIKISKYDIFSIKHQLFLLFAVRVAESIKEYLK